MPFEDDLWLIEREVFGVGYEEDASVDPIATYTIQVFAPEPETDAQEWEHATGKMHQQDQRVLSNLPAMLEAAEEDLTKLLPEGYRAIIKTWDSLDESLAQADRDLAEGKARPYPDKEE